MMKTIDQSSIRKQNVRRILDLLSNAPEMTRNALAEKAGLSLMTVSNLVEVLKSYGVLTFTPITRTESRASGRKAENIALSGETHAWLVLEINSRKFRFTLLGFDQSVLDHGCMSVCCECEIVECLQRFARMVRDRIALSLGQRNLLGVAILTPDSYEKHSDTIRSQHLPQTLGATALKELFRQHLGAYHYIVDKDVKYAVRAFSILMNHADCELLYFLCIGEALGGAVVHDGHLIYGHNFATGDVNLLRDEHQQPYNCQLSIGAFAAALGLSDASAETLSAFALENPERYEQVLTAFVEKTADMLVHEIRSIDPNSIVVECRYAHPMAERYLQLLHDALERRINLPGHKLPELSLVPPTTNIMLAGAVHALQLEWIEQIIT